MTISIQPALPFVVQGHGAADQSAAHSLFTLFMSRMMQDSGFAEAFSGGSDDMGFAQFATQALAEDMAVPSNALYQHFMRQFDGVDT